MAVYAQYRLTSREVIKVFTTLSSPPDPDPVYWGVLTDPSTPDGQAVRETFPDGSMGPFGVLGFAKIADVGGNAIRNATQPEIDTFAAAETADENAQDATRAVSLFEDDPQARKLWTAFAAIVVDEINLLRQQHGLAPRTLAQLKTAVRNRVSAND